MGIASITVNAIFWLFSCTGTLLGPTNCDSLLMRAVSEFPFTYLF